MVRRVESRTDELEEDFIVRKFISVLAAAAMLATSTAAIAADATSSSNSPQALAPAGAVGVHNARFCCVAGAGWWIGAGIVGLGIGTAIVLTSNGGHNSSSTTTTTTP